jgi:hypothetical protein
MGVFTRRSLIGALALGALPPRALAKARKTPDKPVPQPARPLDEADLPAGTRTMLARIRTAAETGDVEALRLPIQRNELPPTFGRGMRGDPIALLKARSADGAGRELLHILMRVLDAGATGLTAGAAPPQYLWPYYANTPYQRRSPAERAASWGLVRVADLGVSLQRGQPLIHRVVIGTDGTWQVFAVL